MSKFSLGFPGSEPHNSCFFLTINHSLEPPASFCEPPVIQTFPKSMHGSSLSISTKASRTLQESILEMHFSVISSISHESPCHRPLTIEYKWASLLLQNQKQKIYKSLENWNRYRKINGKQYQFDPSANEEGLHEWGCIRVAFGTCDSGLMALP